jgi:hypothetical protein
MTIEDVKHDDRRGERRRMAAGDVTLWLNGSLLTVSGHLMDLTKSGFRAGHSSPTLRSGHIVEFELAGVSGRARVVWTRVLADQVESGFLILAEGGGVTMRTGHA